MNRVYLDPNTKYSDQYAMLAKMPDIVDAVNDVADKVEDIPEIPAPAVADIGKVLGVVSDGESGAEYGAVVPSGGLPAIESGDAGKVLTVNSGETGAEWATPSGGGGVTTLYIKDVDPDNPPTMSDTLPQLDPTDYPDGWSVDYYTTYITTTRNSTNALTVEQLNAYDLSNIEFVYVSQYAEEYDRHYKPLTKESETSATTSIAYHYCVFQITDMARDPFGHLPLTDDWYPQLNASVYTPDFIIKTKNVGPMYTSYKAES